MEEEPIEILVSLAEKGEIDPWNIDIVEVTDRFLQELEKRKQLDLRISGRTLFYAATLLRLKSDVLGEEEPACPEEAPLEEEEGAAEFGEPVLLDPVDRLEREIQRRLERRGMRESPVTLYELIQLLKTAEKVERRRRKVHAPAAEPRPIVEDIISIAHREDYRESASELLNAVSVLGGAGDGKISFVELCSHTGWSPADVYIPLLFLTSEGRVGLEQAELFGELFVTTASGSGEEQ